MTSPDSSPSKDPDHRWPTGHNGRPQRVTGQVFPSLSPSASKSNNSMTETLERLRTLSLDSKAMSDSLASEVMQLEDSPTGGKSSPYGASEHNDWMARWHRDTTYNRAIPNTLDVKTSPTSHYEPLRDASVVGQPGGGLLSPAPKRQREIDLASYNRNPNTSTTASSTLEPQSCQPYALFPGAGVFMTPWSAPLLQQSSQTGRTPGKNEEGAAPWTPAHGSLPAASPHAPSSHQQPPPPSLLSFLDDSTVQNSSGTDDLGCIKAKQETKCSECAGLRHELEFVRLQLAAQQSSLNRIVTELATVKNRSPTPRPLLPQGPPPPWRTPQHGAWSFGPPPPPTFHASAMQPPPFPYYCGPYNSSLDPLIAYNGSGEHQATPAPSATDSSPVRPKFPPNTPAGSSPATGQQSQVMEERNPSPKRVSFACPMTQSEFDSDYSSEDALVSKLELGQKKSPHRKFVKSETQSNNPPPALKKASPSSSIRPKPYPATGALKHRLTAYSSSVPRSFYGAMQPGGGAPKHTSRPLWGHQQIARDGSSTGSPPHYLQPSRSLPFVVPPEDGGESSGEDLHVRFDATTLFNFMQYWQPRADGPRPLLVDLSLDASTYHDFLEWGLNNGSLKL